MTPITLEQAQNHLAEILAQLTPGEEVVLTRDDQPIATLKALPRTACEGPRLGTLKGTILHIAPNFDAIPEGFEEYLP
jgi:antitoxin (DNA-binding transcriptional repressor) of toxin-antitoxin stability system